MAKLAELGLKNEQVGGDVDLGNLPKTDGFTPMFQPGRYRFELPTNLQEVWDTVDAQVGQRITAVFDQAAPLKVVQAPDKERVGEPFQTRISNVERARGKDKILVSDLDYLLKALGVTQKPKTNQAYIQALLPMGGKEFPATVEVQYQCSDKRDKYVDDGQGGTTQVEGQKGCGARYYQKDIERVGGVYPERVTCGECGASLRAFSQLSSIG